MSTDGVIGPECPTCGCNATHLVAVGSRFSRPFAKFACDHCSRVFIVGHLPENVDDSKHGAPYYKLRCPSCGGINCKFTSSGRADSSPRVRRHKCGDCGINFKSIEK